MRNDQKNKVCVLLLFKEEYTDGRMMEVLQHIQRRIREVIFCIWDKK